MKTPQVKPVDLALVAISLAKDDKPTVQHIAQAVDLLARCVVFAPEVERKAALIAKPATPARPRVDRVSLPDAVTKCDVSERTLKDHIKTLALDPENLSAKDVTALQNSIRTRASRKGTKHNRKEV